METKINDTKRIAKNTIVLYGCTILSMLVTLYSSRLVLQTLVVDDFGLYNVVCGVAALLSFMKTSLTSSTQRFLSFELGKGDDNQLKRVFSMSLTTHIVICLILVLLAETVGLWFLNTHIQMSPGREVAANWIYQFSIISLCFSTCSVPYSADIISHERMTFYAVVHVIASVLKLIAALVILLDGFDKLIVYGLLMAVVEILSFIMYLIYCRIRYIETVYKLFFDRKLFAQIFSFSGWTIMGQIAVVAANNGTTILVNIYHSVAANAAMGIAQQVNNAITSITSNFQTAFQPQITKSYSVNDAKYLNSIVCQASKISYFMLFVVSVPVIMNIDWLLEVWLGKVPEYANTFSILFLVASWMNAVSAPLWIAVYSTGKIRAYQIMVSLVFFSDILIVWALFHYFDVPPTASMVVKAVINFIVIFVRLWYTGKLVECFSTPDYLKTVIVPCISCSAIVMVPMFLCNTYITNLYSLLGISVIVTLFACVVVYYCGFVKEERQNINKFILSYTNKINK